MVFSATNKKGQAPLKELKNKKTKQYALLLLKNGMVGKNIKGLRQSQYYLAHLAFSKQKAKLKKLRKK